MKTEQEIVLQKKMIIIFSLVILAVTMGILNIKKENLKLASAETEIFESGETINIRTEYTANEEFFIVKDENSGEVVEEFEKDDTEDKNEEKNVEIAKAQETENVETSKVEEKEVVKVASRGSYIRDTSTPPTEYKSVMQVKATAYCLCKKCCGKSPDNPRYGYTASGLRILPGTGMKVIAVDTSVVPLGTNVYVEGLYGAGNYGYAVAADTGSAIKNMKIDLYMDTHEQALSWGVKTVNLYILDK